MKLGLFFYCFLFISCSETKDVNLHELEEKFSLNIQLLSVEYARHHLDFGFVYVKLRERPSDAFWIYLEVKGWRRQRHGTQIAYIRNEYKIEYIDDEGLLIIKRIATQ